MNFKLKQIIKNRLCIGCGLCEEIARKDGVQMQLNKDGFYEPTHYKQLSKENQCTLHRLCPAIHLECIANTETFCGKIMKAYEGWSLNTQVRRVASSGGIITTLACYLLESKQVTGVLQVGTCKNSYLHNELKLSRTTEDIIACASSRYAPALIFDKLSDTFQNPTDKFLFIGKPCDIMTLKKYISIHPEYADKISIYISLVCAGIPSYHATMKLIKSANNTTRPIHLKYRGDGWPGNFKVEFEDGKSFCRSYNDSWGTVLGREINFRCKICPDGIGQYADIVVGDAWDTQDGYPDFSEKEGKSFILTRTEKGEKILQLASRDKKIFLTSLKIQDLKSMQPYQYMRLFTIAYKLIPAFFLTKGILKIKNLRIKKYNVLKGLRISLGTIYRFYKRNQII